MPVVTVIQGAVGFKSPKYISAEVVIEQIRNCSIQKKVDTLRSIKDTKKNREYKKGFPSIMFAGKFKDRGDVNIQEPSGLCVVDFDHLAEPEKKKEEISKNPFVYAAFISPNGDGVKAVCRIPADIKKYKGHYNALMKFFNQPEVDSTSQNLERLCFASCDSTVYFNPNAVEFTEYISTEENPIQQNGTPKTFNGTDYRKLGVAAKMIQQAPDKQKHGILLKASKLMGGYIASGHINEQDAVNMLESEIGRKDIDDFKLAQRTIKDGINYGKTQPIFETEEFKQYQPQTYYSTTTETIIDDFIATEKDADEYIEQVRNGTFKMGLSTMFPKLDDHWRFKPANVVVINGHDNVGKSVLMWYLATLSALFHDWSWIIYSNENKIGGVKKKIIEFYKCRSIKSLSEDELKECKIWFDKHFTIIKNTELFTYKDMISIGRKLNQKKQYNGFLIDPYNSLWADTNDRHEYDYKVMTEFRQFVTQTGCGIYLNCHAITEALRRKYPKGHFYEGYPMPPDKADTEGGGKFSNKADDFITIHRLVQHPNDWMFTEIHVKKIKEMETGGKHTFLEEPIKLRMIPGSCGFEDETGFNPVTGKVYKQEILDIPQRISTPKEKNNGEQYEV